MGLWERVTREQEPKIPVHTLMAALAELERGEITTQQVIDLFSLSAGEQTELATILAKVVPPRECISLGGFNTLTNVGVAYDTIAAAQGLGVALVQTAGITRIIFGVKVNKIGTGTQSWQLFNETDGTEVAVIDDAGAAGVKNLSTTKDFGTPLAAGFKTIRVRAKSTTAADDPVYFGATVSIQRVAVLTGIELHEVLLLADINGGPYATASALKTRLGV